MKDEKYNGWTNYETWNFSLWNDFYSLAEEFDYLQDELAEDRDGVIRQIENALEEQTEEMCPFDLSGASFYHDIFGAALQQVNWYEIAEHVVEQMEERIAQNDF